jgi:hypothetical protein
MQSQDAFQTQAAPSGAPRPSAAQIAAIVEAAYILDAVRR